MHGMDDPSLSAKAIHASFPTALEAICGKVVEGEVVGGKVEGHESAVVAMMVAVVGEAVMCYVAWSTTFEACWLDIVRMMGIGERLGVLCIGVSEAAGFSMIRW